MTCEAFIERAFRADTLAIIETANEIIDEYAEQGFQLTLRQLYYQFVTRDVIPNKQSEYKRLGSIINDARLAGLVDWSAIEDRTRNVRSVSAWSSPQEIMEAVAGQYREDLWLEQSFRPEIWIEKDALVGVIAPVCERYRVPYFACRGYTSQSEQYAAGKRFAAHREAGYTPIVLHLGDHDPSGLDMTRDNADRLAMFAREDVHVKRLALNMDQVEAYSPPPNPAKDTDARFAGYRNTFGDESWELDALSPTVIDALISEALDELIDRGFWEGAVDGERTRREDLQSASHHWPVVVEFLRGAA